MKTITRSDLYCAAAKSIFQGKTHIISGCLRTLKAFPKQNWKCTPVTALEKKKMHHLNAYNCRSKVTNCISASLNVNPTCIMLEIHQAIHLKGDGKYLNNLRPTAIGHHRSEPV